MSTEYNLDLLETKYLAGHPLTEAEMTALQEGPRWDAIKNAAGTVGRGAKAAVKGVGRLAGKAIGATGKTVGAVASAPQGFGRAVKQGYQKGLDTIAPGYQPRSSIGQAIAQPAQAAPAQAAPAKKPMATRNPQPTAAPAKKPMATRNPQPTAAPAQSAPKSKSAAELATTLKAGDPVTYTNKKGEQNTAPFVGVNPANPKMLMLKNRTNQDFAVYATQVKGNEPPPPNAGGTLGDIQQARYQAGLMPDSQLDVKKDVARNQATTPKAVNNRMPDTSTTNVPGRQRSTTAVKDKTQLGQQTNAVPRGGVPGATGKDLTKPLPRKKR